MFTFIFDFFHLELQLYEKAVFIPPCVAGRWDRETWRGNKTSRVYRPVAQQSCFAQANIAVRFLPVPEGCSCALSRVACHVFDCRKKCSPVRCVRDAVVKGEV